MWVDHSNLKFRLCLGVATSGPLRGPIAMPSVRSQIWGGFVIDGLGSLDRIFKINHTLAALYILNHEFIVR